MNIQVIAEHSVCMDLLPPKANILDLGARGGQFANYFKELGHNVFSVDCDNLPGITHPNLAISDYDGIATIIKDKDPQATRIKRYREGMPSVNLVECWTLQKFSESVDVEVDGWDLIKFDIEGSEREVIHAMNYAPAKQISLEAHCHTNIYSKDEAELMMIKLQSLGYLIVHSPWTQQHGSGWNYWDILAILK